MENITIENWECAIKDEMKRKYPSDIVFITLYKGNSNSVFIHSHRVVDGNKIATMFFNTEEKELFNSLNLGKEEIYLAKFENGEFIEKSIWDELIPKEYYEINELVYIYKKYNLMSKADYKKVELALKRESEFKDKLVYFCYKNDTTKILEHLNVADETELNQQVKFIGTPLELCALNNNLECFKAIVEKGADIRVNTRKYDTLYNAFKYSPDIATYIYEKHNDYFKEAISEKGYFIYCYSENLDLFNLVKQAGGNPNLIVDGYPSIYSFIETDNIVAVKFLIENGADINMLDKKNRTMLDYAKGEKAKNVLKLLKSMKAKTGAEVLEIKDDDLNSETLKYISQIEKIINNKLPESFKNLYIENKNVEINGQTFMNLVEVISEMEYGEFEIDTEDDVSIKSEIDGRIKRKMYVKERVPFIQDYSGNFVGIDFVPDKKGVIGQIISYGRDEKIMRVFANSFDDFVEGLKNIVVLDKKTYIVDYLVKNKITFIK